MKRNWFLFTVLSVFTATASCVMAADQSAQLTQAEYLQWLVRIQGDDTSIPAQPTTDDCLRWARENKIQPNGGWKPEALLTREAFAETLAQLFGLPAQDNAVAALAKEGVTIPGDKLVARRSMMKAIDEFGFQSRLSLGSSRERQAAHAVRAHEQVPSFLRQGGRALHERAEGQVPFDLLGRIVARAPTPHGYRSASGPKLRAAASVGNSSYQRRWIGHGHLQVAGGMVAAGIARGAPRPAVAWVWTFHSSGGLLSIDARL